MKVFSELKSASLENLSSDASAGTTGRIWWNTTEGRVKVDNFALVVSLLANDDKAVFGTDGTADNNVRFHRSGDSLLQIVKGGDTTAEGTESANVAMLSTRLANFTDAARPAGVAANAGRTIFNTDQDALQVNNNAGGWDQLSSDAALKSTSVDVRNHGIDTSVAASALTVSLKTRALADPSAGDPVQISFGNVVDATGDFVLRSVTAALSVTIPSGGTLGHQDGEMGFIYVYAVDNAGTIELALSGIMFDEGMLENTTTATAGSDLGDVLYANTGVLGKRIRLLARLESAQVTAGTWAVTPQKEALVPFEASYKINQDESSAVTSSTSSIVFIPLSPVLEANLTVNKTSVVLVTLKSISDGGFSVTSVTNSFISGFYQILRGGTVIAEQKLTTRATPIGGTITIRVPATFTMYDLAPPGAHTYSVKFKTSDANNTVAFENTKIAVVELNG